MRKSNFTRSRLEGTATDDKVFRVLERKAGESSYFQAVVDTEGITVTIENPAGGSEGAGAEWSTSARLTFARPNSHCRSSLGRRSLPALQTESGGAWPGAGDPAWQIVDVLKAIETYHLSYRAAFRSRPHAPRSS
jgi:hypothetical protein